MGAHPYFYFVKYQPNVQKALDELRAQEFQAGRYNPVMPFMEFPVDENSPAPGKQHATIDDAMEDADADGTRSILDIAVVGNEPDFGVTVPLTDEQLMTYFGTTQPTRDLIDESDVFEDIERGQCVHTVIYDQGKPSHLFFAGYSFD
jgi:hypothetical protein